MKRLTTAALAATLVASPLAIATAESASAANPRCITKAEFRKVTKGLTTARVARIVGANGSQTSYSPAYPSIGIAASQTREYQPCDSEYGFVWVDFDRLGGVWKVTSKTAYWG